MDAAGKNSILQHIRDSGGVASDGPVRDDFVSGWAVHPFSASSGIATAHWYERHALNEVDRAQVSSATGKVWSLCRRVLQYESARAGLLGVGNVRRCKLCERMTKLRKVA